MARLSRHAAQRFHERVPILAGCAPRDLIALWAAGRDADRTDFLVFRAQPREGRRYRVIQHQRREYLLVRDAADGEFVTVMKKQ